RGEAHCAAKSEEGLNTPGVQTFGLLDVFPSPAVLPPPQDESTIHPTTHNSFPVTPGLTCRVAPFSGISIYDSPVLSSNILLLQHCKARQMLNGSAGTAGCDGAPLAHSDKSFV